MKEEKLSQVVKNLSTGWPTKCNTSGELSYYFILRNELILEDKLVYSGMRLVVPKKLSSFFMKMLHYTHLGMTKTIGMAKQLFLLALYEKRHRKLYRNMQHMYKI